MANLTVEKNTPDTGTVVPVEPQEPRLHRGPVARLLAKVSRLTSEYADYQMEHCEERKLHI